MCLRHLLPFDWRFSLHVRHTETSSLVARFALLRVRFPFPVLWCCKERASAEWQFALRRPRTRGVRGNKKSAELPFPRASSLKRCRKCATPKTGHEHVIFGRGVGTQQPQASVSFRDARTCSPHTKQLPLFLPHLCRSSLSLVRHQPPPTSDLSPECPGSHQPSGHGAQRSSTTARRHPSASAFPTAHSSRHPRHPQGCWNAVQMIKEQPPAIMNTSHVAKAIALDAHMAHLRQIGAHPSCPRAHLERCMGHAPCGETFERKTPCGQFAQQVKKADGNMANWVETHSYGSPGALPPAEDPVTYHHILRQTLQVSAHLVQKTRFSHKAESSPPQP